MIPAPSIRKDCCGARALGHQGWVQGLSFSPLGAPSCCASVDRAGQLRVHSVQGPHGLAPLGEVFNDGVDLSQLTAVCWCGPDYLCFGGANGLLRIRHISDPTIGYTTPRRLGHTGPVLSVVSTGARGHLVLSGGADGRIRLWDPRGRWGLERASATVSAGYHAVRSLAATHGGTDYTTLVAADGGPSGILNVYDTRRPRGLFEDVQEFGSASKNLPRADPRWRGFTHAPEGNAVAALRGHRSLARSVCMSTSGDVVATGSDDKTVRFWDLSRPAAVEGGEDYPNNYGDVDDGVSGYHSGSGYRSGYGGQYGGKNNDGNDNHSAAYNSQFTSGSGAGGAGGMSWMENGSLSFGTVGGTWEHLQRDYANGRGSRDGGGSQEGGGWGGGLQSNGSGSGVWGGVGGCREVTSQQLLLPHSVLSISCDPEGRAVVATDLKGGVFCSVQVNYVAKRSSKVDNCGDKSMESDFKSSECERKTSPEGPHDGTDDDNNDDSENDKNGDNSTENQSESNLGGGGNNESYLDGGSLFTESGGGRRAAKLGTLAGRPLCAAVSHDGYYGVVGADRGDDCALRLFDLRLVMTAAELKRDGFEAPALRSAGLECSQLRSAGFTAEQCSMAGYSLKELGVFGARVLLDTFPEWDIPELKEAGFDNPRELRELGYSAIQLKANAFQPRELLGGGYSVLELTQAGIKGKQLQALGISMDQTLDAAWQQGREAYFHELVQTVLDWDYATDAAVRTMHEQIKAGTHPEAYHAHMWETRLSLTECRVTWIPPHQELVSTEHDLSNTQDRIEEQKHTRDHDSAASTASSPSGHHHHVAPASQATAVGRKLQGHYVWQDETNPALVALRDALLEKEALAAAELEEVKSEAEHLLHGASTSTEWSQNQASHAQQDQAAREAAAAHLAAAEAAVEAAERVGGGEQVWVREEAALRAKEEAAAREAEEAKEADARDKAARREVAAMALGSTREETSSPERVEEEHELKRENADNEKAASQPMSSWDQTRQPGDSASVRIAPVEENISGPLLAESPSTINIVDAATLPPKRGSSTLVGDSAEASFPPGHATTLPPNTTGTNPTGTAASGRFLKAGGRTAKL